MQSIILLSCDTFVYSKQFSVDLPGILLKPKLVHCIDNSMIDLDHAIMNWAVYKMRDNEIQ